MNRRSLLLESVVVAVGTLTLLHLLFPPVVWTDDLLNHLLLARDSGSGAVVGPPASLWELQHGTLWIRLLAVVQELGVPIAALRLALLALAAWSVAWLHTALARLAPGLRGLGTGAFVAAMVTLLPFTTLWNPSILPLPAVAVLAGCLRAARGEPRRGLAVAVLGAALATDANLVCGVFLPLVAVVAGVVPHRALTAVGAVLLVLAGAIGALWLVSPGPMASNVGELAQHASLGTTLALLACLAAPWPARWLWHRLPEPSRLGWMMLGLGAPLLAAALAGWAREGRVVPHYLFPFVAPTIVAVLVWGEAGVRPLHLSSRAVFRFATAAGVALLAVAAAEARDEATRTAAHAWSVEEAEHASDLLRARGWRFDDAWARVRGPAFDAVVKMHAARSAATDGGSAARGDELQFVKVDAPLWRALGSTAPGSWQGTGGSSGARILVKSFAAWLRGRGLTFCPVDADGRQRACRAADMTWPGGGAAPVPFASLRGMELPALSTDREFERGAAACRVVVPLRIVGSDAWRVLALPFRDGCAWTIREVRGVAWQGRLPATRVTIRQDPAVGAAGVVVFEARLDGRCAWARLPPALELSPDDDGLIAASAARTEGLVLQPPPR